MMKTIEKTFCKNLKIWTKKNFKGTRAELAKQFGVSQGYVSNILAGRNCGDETWRRMVAKKIGIDYDTMIGIEKDQNENIVVFTNTDDERHFEVTQRFKNKPLAIEINMGLVEVEQYDPEELEEIKELIIAKLKKHRKKQKQKDKASGE